jgi:hypothetical protein
MRQQRDDFDDFGFAPLQRYDHQPRRYEQQRYKPRQRYNGGQIVDPVEQLRQLLQAAPMANAVVPPALAYQAPPAVVQVHVWSMNLPSLFGFTSIGAVFSSGLPCTFPTWT